MKQFGVTGILALLNEPKVLTVKSQIDQEISARKDSVVWKRN